MQPRLQSLAVGLITLFAVCSVPRSAEAQWNPPPLVLPNLPEPAKPLNGPGLNVPQALLPQGNLPQLNLPQSNLPQWNVPQLNVPQLNLPQLNPQPLWNTPQWNPAIGLSLQQQQNSQGLQFQQQRETAIHQQNLAVARERHRLKLEQIVADGAKKGLPQHEIAFQTAKASAEFSAETQSADRKLAYKHATEQRNVTCQHQIQTQHSAVEVERVRLTHTQAQNREDLALRQSLEQIKLNLRLTIEGEELNLKIAQLRGSVDQAQINAALAGHSRKIAFENEQLRLKHSLESQQVEQQNQVLSARFTQMEAAEHFRRTQPAPTYYPGQWQQNPWQTNPWQRNQWQPAPWQPGIWQPGFQQRGFQGGIIIRIR